MLLVGPRGKWHKSLIWSDGKRPIFPCEHTSTTKISAIRFIHCHEEGKSQNPNAPPEKSNFANNIYDGSFHQLGHL